MGIPARDRVVEPGDQVNLRLGMVPLKGTTDKDPLDGLSHVEPGATERGVEWHDAVVEQPADDGPAQVAGQVVPDQEESERGQRFGRLVAEPGRPPRQWWSLVLRASDGWERGEHLGQLGPEPGWSTALGALVTPLARTSPVAGRNRVSSLAVPPRMYSCGRSAGFPTGAQVAPGCGIAWYGPASSWHQTGSPAASPSRYAWSMAPFFLPSADRPPAPRRPCASVGPSRSGTTSASVGTSCPRRAAPAGSSSRPRAGAPPDAPSAPGSRATTWRCHRLSDPVAAGRSPRSGPGPSRRTSAAARD